MSDHLVKLWDPSSPDKPVEELRANFHPERHVRWENRPRKKGDSPVPATAAQPEELVGNSPISGRKGVRRTLADPS